MKSVLRGAIIFLTLLSGSFAVPAWAENPPSLSNTKSAANQQVINLNTADAKMITDAHIKGIGKKRAEAIIAYRSQHGAFKTIDELKNIKGLSAGIINNNRERLTLK